MNDYTTGAKRDWAQSFILKLAFGVFLGITIGLNFKVHFCQHFALLANSFLQGRLDFIGPALRDLSDMTPHNGGYYWPLGPLPAVVLMPFELAAAAVGAFFYQGYLQPFLVFALLAIVFGIARQIGYDCEDSGYLAFGFAFATAFLGVGIWPWSWYFAQVLTSVLIFASIDEMIGRRRPLILGILFALALATRVTAALGVFWCIGEVLCDSSSWRKKLRSLVAVGFPCFAVLALLLLYNYARFGNAFEQGYAAQIIPRHASAARAIGLLSLRHIPGNLYYLLLAAPTTVSFDKVSAVLAFPFVAANPWGMSIFVTSPCLLYMFGLRYCDKTSCLLLLTVVVIALPILLYYGVGYVQFGYRYSLDFMPFLYFLLLRNYRLQRGDLTTGFKAVLIASAVWNLYLFAGCFLRVI